MKRVSHLMRESLEDISRQWLELVKSNPELAAIRLPDNERIDHLPQLIEEMANRVDSCSEETTDAGKTAAIEAWQRARPARAIPFH